MGWPGVRDERAVSEPWKFYDLGHDLPIISQRKLQQTRRNAPGLRLKPSIQIFKVLGTKFRSWRYM